jgi:signal transduction histidine kinase
MATIFPLVLPFAFTREREKALGPVDLNGLVERVLQLAGGQMRQSGIRVETALDDNLPQVMGDATALERVLINLLTNARDAMRQGGGVVAIASGAMSGRPGWIYLSVTDDGPGISAEALGKIFDLLSGSQRRCFLPRIQALFGGHRHPARHAGVVRSAFAGFL